MSSPSSPAKSPSKNSAEFPLLIDDPHPHPPSSTTRTPHVPFPTASPTSPDSALYSHETSPLNTNGPNGIDNDSPVKTQLEASKGTSTDSHSSLLNTGTVSDSLLKTQHQDDNFWHKGIFPTAEEELFATSAAGASLNMSSSFEFESMFDFTEETAPADLFGLPPSPQNSFRKSPERTNTSTVEPAEQPEVSPNSSRSLDEAFLRAMRPSLQTKYENAVAQILGGSSSPQKSLQTSPQKTFRFPPGVDPDPRLLSQLRSPSPYLESKLKPLGHSEIPKPGRSPERVPSVLRVPTQSPSSEPLPSVRRTPALVDPAANDAPTSFSMGDDMIDTLFGIGPKGPPKLRGYFLNKKDSFNDSHELMIPPSHGGSLQGAHAVPSPLGSSGLPTMNKDGTLMGQDNSSSPGEFVIPLMHKNEMPTHERKWLLETQLFKALHNQVPSFARTVVSSTGSPTKRTTPRISSSWISGSENTTLNPRLGLGTPSLFELPPPLLPSQLEMAYEGDLDGLQYARDLSTSKLIPAPLYPYPQPAEVPVRYYPRPQYPQLPLSEQPNPYDPAPEEAEYAMWLCMWSDITGCKRPVSVARTGCFQCTASVPPDNHLNSTITPRIESMRRQQLERDFVAARMAQTPPSSQLRRVLKRKHEEEGHNHNSIGNFPARIGGDEKRMRSGNNMAGDMSTKEKLRRLSDMLFGSSDHKNSNLEGSSASGKPEIKNLRLQDGKIAPTEIVPTQNVAESSPTKTPQKMYTRDLDGSLIPIGSTSGSRSRRKMEARYSTPVDTSITGTGMNILRLQNGSRVPV